MLSVIFKYELDKDVENFIRASKSKNSSKLTRLQEVYVSIYGNEYEPSKVREFLMAQTTSQSFDAQADIVRLQTVWEKIAPSYIERAEHMFGISYPASTVTAYLTQNQRCTYNIPENYFFVYFASKSPERIIMHELFHFYTWHAFHNNLIAAGASESEYNDVKESLTVLLNEEFKDLMGTGIDEGYPQHQEMRKKILSLWNESRDLKKVMSAFSVK